MGVKLVVKTEGVEEFQRVLRKINPEENPEVLRAGMKRAAKRLQHIIRTRYLRGPRPRRLDQVTGELARSIHVHDQRAELWVEVGTPLFWTEFHEVGIGRFRARPFIEPAVEDIVEELPGILLASWEKESQK